tara:strand:- start:1031 stop:2905 length:1875 start_codon:yes stop_codon:yes gene_type:complete
MVRDFFAQLDLKNRRAFRLEGRDGLEYRDRLLTQTAAYESELRSILPSTYQSSITGPNYTIALRAYAIEFAKIKLALDDAYGDLSFTSEGYSNLRADLMYQKVGSLLALNNSLPLGIFDSAEFHQFAQALIAAFYRGSTPAGLVESIETLVGEEGTVSLREFFQEEMDPASTVDLSDQFTFQVDLFVSDTMSAAYADLPLKIGFLLNVIKPAHTLFLLRQIFSDIVTTLQDVETLLGIETLWGHGYDDARRYQQGVKNLHRLGARTVSSITEPIPAFAGTVFYLSNGPVAKSQVVPELATSSDITVTVNGSEVSVSDFRASDGYVELSSAVTVSDAVSVAYSYWVHQPSFPLQIGDAGTALGHRVHRLGAKFHVGSKTLPAPAEVTWSATGIERAYTTTLGDPDSFRLGGLQDVSTLSKGRLGQANVVEIESVTLNDTTPLFELQNALNPTVELDIGEVVTDEEAWGTGWGEDVWGGAIAEAYIDEDTATYEWVVIAPGRHFTSHLTYSSTSTGTEGLLSLALDLGTYSLTISGFTDELTWPGQITYCDSQGAFALNTTSLSETVFLSAHTQVGCEMSLEISTDEPYSDVVEYDSTDEGYIVINANGTIYHLDEGDRTLHPGYP